MLPHIICLALGFLPRYAPDIYDFLNSACVLVWAGTKMGIR